MQTSAISVSHVSKEERWLTLAVTDVSDPESTEHRSKASTLMGWEWRGANTQDWTSTEESGFFCCLLLAFNLDEDLLM